MPLAAGRRGPCGASQLGASEHDPSGDTGGCRRHRQHDRGQHRLCRSAQLGHVGHARRVQVWQVTQQPFAVLGAAVGASGTVLARATPASRGLAARAGGRAPAGTRTRVARGRPDDRLLALFRAKSSRPLLITSVRVFPSRKRHSLFQYPGHPGPTPVSPAWGACACSGHCCLPARAPDACAAGQPPASWASSCALPGGGGLLRGRCVGRYSLGVRVRTRLSRRRLVVVVDNVCLEHDLVEQLLNREAPGQRLERTPCASADRAQRARW